jgi:hypothetical protein
MTDVANYIPSEDEVNEVLDLYDEWLQEEYAKHGDKDKAIDEATERVTRSENQRAFYWVVDHDNARIYDVDDSIVES